MLKTIILALGLGLMLISCASPDHVKDAAQPDKTPALAPTLQPTESAAPAQPDVAPQNQPVSGVPKLISQLGAADFQSRQSAQQALEDMGPEIEAALEKAGSDPDPEIKDRTEKILPLIRFKKRLGFSETLLKERPDIYRDLFKSNLPNKVSILSGLINLNNEKYRAQDLNSDIQLLISELLLTNGQTENKKQRYDAIFELAKQGVKESLPEVLKFIHEYDDRNFTRPPAIVFIESVRAQEAIPAIMELIKKREKFLLGPAIKCAAALQAREAIPECLKIINEGELFDSRHAFDLLIALGVTEPYETLFRAAPHINYYRSANKAVSYVRKISRSEHITFLLEQLKGSDEKTKQLAMGIIQQLGAKQAVPNFLENLKARQDRNTMRQAINTLVAFQVRETVPILMDLLKEKDDPLDIKWYVIEALGNFRAKEAGPLLWEYSTDERYGGAALFALADLGDPKAPPEIIKYMYRRQDFSAMEKLGQIKYIEFIPELIKLLKSPDQWRDIHPMSDAIGMEPVRSEAIRVLHMLGAKEALPEVCRLLDDPDWRVVNQAVYFVTRFKDKDSIAKLRQLLDDDSAYLAAVQALKTMDDKESIPLIEATLKTKNSWLRCWAAVDLIDWGATANIPKEVIGDIKRELKNNPEPATRALKKLGFTDEDIRKAREEANGK